MDQSMAELTQKIDALTAQVAYLTEQAGLPSASALSALSCSKVCSPLGPT